MSIDIQADLTNVERAREINGDYLQAEREAAYAGGARYRSPITTESADAGEDLSHEKCVCQGCGATVTPTYWRGNSDNDGVLWHCHDCPDVNQSDMKNGAGAKPDFEPRITNHESRQGGEF